MLPEIIRGHSFISGQRRKSTVPQAFVRSCFRIIGAVLSARNCLESPETARNRGSARVFGSEMWRYVKLLKSKQDKKANPTTRREAGFFPSWFRIPLMFHSMSGQPPAKDDRWFKSRRRGPHSKIAKILCNLLPPPLRL